MKAGEGFKLLDDFEIVGTVDNTRDAFQQVQHKINTLEKEVVEEEEDQTMPCNLLEAQEKRKELLKDLERIRANERGIMGTMKSSEKPTSEIMRAKTVEFRELSDITPTSPGFKKLQTTLNGEQKPLQ